MGKHNRKGRSKGYKRFVMLEHYILNSPAWRSLSCNARVAYIELLTIYNGSNNGRIAMSARRLADLMPVSRQTASRALSELVDRNFIEVTTPSAFGYKVKRAAEYRLTEYRCDVTGLMPTKAFMKWRPSKDNSRPQETTSAAPQESQNAA